MEWPHIDINGSLQRFNEWFDSFILEAIKPLSILSMGLGTVAVFNLQGLAIDPRFVVSWAIVQALSMDGLFFATWDKLFSVKLQWHNALAIIGLGFIGLTLAIVAIAINAILGFQVLWGIADSQGAMSRLGISSELFTIVRAILAVAVFVMVSFVRSRARATTKPTVAIVAKGQRSQKKAMVIEEKATQRAIPEHSVAIEKATQDADGVAFIATSKNGHYDKIKATWLQFTQEGKAIKLTDIAEEAGVGYSTVKKWAGEIRREIEQSTGGD